MARWGLAVIIATLALWALAPAPARAQGLGSPRIVNGPEVFQPVFVSDPQGAIRAARERIAAGDLAGATKQLAIYVAAHPDEVGPARFLGDLYYRLGEFGKAENLYVALLAKNPTDKETHNRLGVVYATENRVDDAIEQFNKALPGTDSVGDLVAMHVRKGDLQQYRDTMQREAESHPTDANLQAEMGQIYAALHQPGYATLYFRRALDNDSTSLTATNGLGLALLDTHDYDGARAQFKRCLELDPTNYTCTNNMAATELQAGRGDQAEPLLARAHQLEPERPEALVNYGYLADLHGDWKRAVTYYVQATVVGPYLPEAYVDLGVDYEHNGLYALAEAALLKGVSAAPQDGRIRYLLAVAYTSLGHTNLAIEQLKLASQSLDPDVARIAREESRKLVETTTATPQR